MKKLIVILLVLILTACVPCGCAAPHQNDDKPTITVEKIKLPSDKNPELYENMVNEEWDKGEGWVTDIGTNKKIQVHPETGEPLTYEELDARYDLMVSNFDALVSNYQKEITLYKRYIKNLEEACK